MERIIFKQLVDWKNDKNRKPLIIRGARQVGKSYSVLDFGKKHFKGNILTVNFEKQRDWHSIFELNLDANRIVAELEIVLNSRIEPGNTLLFFDEVQECQNALRSLRYFYEQIPDLHIIAAGSLLDFALENISFPVGRVQFLNMYPLNFYEFLLANKKQILAELIVHAPQELSETVDNTIKQELRKYFYVGGMPECVKTFTETQSYLKVSQVQENLIESLKQDFSKYAARIDKNCLLSVLKSVVRKVGEQIKYSELAEGYSNPTIKKSFDLLEKAKLYRKIQAVSGIELPLGATVSGKKFKCLMLDIGLLAHLNGFSLSEEYLKHDVNALFRGKMAEQFVGQEFLSAGQNNLYYWARKAKNSKAEIDFILQKGRGLIPVEVKSGPAGKLKSLHLCLETHTTIEQTAVFSEAQFGTLPEQKITFIPLYFAYGFASN